MGGDIPGTIPYAVNANGSVIVGQAESPNGTEAFRWTQANGIQGLGFLPTGMGSSQAFGVSGDGTIIVGTSVVFENGSEVTEAFRWTGAGGMQGLGDLPGGPTWSVAPAISADGSTIVGAGSTSASFTNQAFRWTSEDGMIGLGYLPGQTTGGEALAVSGDGSIIVGDAGPAFIWDEVHGMRELRTVLQDDFGLNLSNWTLGAATGISADGSTIVGYGVDTSDPNPHTEAWIAVLPEPSGAMLAALGLSALVSRRR